MPKRVSRAKPRLLPVRYTFKCRDGTLLIALSAHRKDDAAVFELLLQEAKAHGGTIVMSTSAAPLLASVQNPLEPRLTKVLSS